MLKIRVRFPSVLESFVKHIVLRFNESAYDCFVPLDNLSEKKVKGNTMNYRIDYNLKLDKFIQDSCLWLSSASLIGEM